MKLHLKKSIHPESAKIFDVIIAPVVTEKSTLGTQNRRYTFRINRTSTKFDVKTAVEKIFKVTVEGVNILNVKGKTKNFRGRPGKRSDYKKAIVKLAEGQTLDIGAGF